MQTSVNRRSFLASFAASLAAPGLATIAEHSALALIAAARRQVGVTRSYDPSYSVLGYPNGDVARNKGVCTDVVIRAYRDAFGTDLQVLINNDIRVAFATYPHIWGLHSADHNIDHRRVPNLQTYFTRHNARLPLPNSNVAWRPGDIFTCLVANRFPHIGIVSDQRGMNGNLLVIHNIGAGTREEDTLFAYHLTGRYRYLLDG